MTDEQRVGDAGDVGEDTVTTTLTVAPAGAPVVAPRFPKLTVPSKPAVVAAVAGLLVVGLLFAMSAVLPMFLVGLVLCYLLDPAVTWLARHHVHRIIGSILMIIVLFVVV